MGTVSLGVGRVLFFYFFPGYPLAISRFIWLPGSGPGWRRQSAHCPGPVECGRMLLAVASPPPALGWLFCFHPCLGMSSLGIGAGGGGMSAFGVSHLRWGRRCPSGMGITSYIKGSFQICSLIAGGNPASRCLEVPDVSGAIQGVSRHCRIIYCCVGGTFPPCCLPQLLRLQNHMWELHNPSPPRLLLCLHVHRHACAHAHACTAWTGEQTPRASLVAPATLGSS